MDTSFFGTFEGKVHQRALQTLAEYSLNLPGSFVWFIQIYSIETATRLKISGLLSCPVHMVLLNFSKEKMKSLVQSGQRLVPLYSVKLKNVKI